MTLALIAFIAFLALGFIQKAKFINKTRNEKSRTKTNVKLQNKIEQAIDEIIFSDIEQLAAAGLSRGEALDKLHDKYNVPRAKDAENSVYEWCVCKHDPFENLRRLLTKREMNRFGYAYSHDGKESGRQRSEADRKKFQDLNKKYPWL